MRARGRPYKCVMPVHHRRDYGLALRCDAFDLIAEYVVCRFGHIAVVIAVEMKDAYIGVAGELEHAPHVKVFFVAAIELFFGVPGDEDNRWRVGAYMIQGRILVDCGLKCGNLLHVAVCEVGYHLAAVRYEGSDGISFYAVFGKPFPVKANHCGQIASGRVSGDEDSAWRTAELLCIVKSPCYGARGIVDA